MSAGQRLTGQVAVVTGGGRGVGRAIARELAAAGARVAVAARSKNEVEATAAEIRSAGGRAEALSADVTDTESVALLVGEAESRLGSPTLLVNNAGTWRQLGPLGESDVHEWWSDVEVSLKGTFLCTRAVLPGMLERGSGRIVNVCSYAGVEPRPYAAGYASGKAAVLRLTDSLAAELEGRGVSVFAITPGFVRTHLVEAIMASPGADAYAPGLAERQDALDPRLAGMLTVEIASGRLDRLSGLLLHVLDDREVLLQRVDEIRAQGLYTLRMRTLPREAENGPR